MRAGIGDEAMRIIVRLKVRGLWVGAEPELQNGHAGKSELLPQGLDLGSNHPEVLRYDGNLPNALSTASNSGAPGPFTHLPAAAVLSPAGIS